MPLIATGFAMVCTVCVPRGSDTAQLPERRTSHRSACPQSRAAGHAQEVICNFNFNIGPNSEPRPGGEQRPMRRRQRPGVKIGPGAPTTTPGWRAQVQCAARQIAASNYADYSGRFLSPSISLMVKAGCGSGCPPRSASLWVSDSPP